MNPREHIMQNPSNTGFVSTSKSFAAASALDLGEPGFICEVEAQGIDVNAIYGDAWRYAHELEVAVPRAIPACDIVGCTTPSGEWIANPQLQTSEVLMPATEVTVAARCDGELTEAKLSFIDSDPCVVEVSLASGLNVAKEASDLFEALVQVRLELERDGVELACNGAREDVYPSAMLRQAARGRRAYVLDPTLQPGAKPTSVDIFEPADWSKIVRVDVQRAAFESWLGI